MSALELGGTVPGGEQSQDYLHGHHGLPGENNVFLLWESGASMGQGTQGWPWELPRRVTVTCSCLSLPQVLFWWTVPSALTVPAQGSVGLILQEGSAQEG